MTPEHPHTSPCIKETTPALLVTLERTLGALDLALCSQHGQSHWETLTHLVKTIDGLLTLMEHDGRPPHVAMTGDAHEPPTSIRANVALKDAPVPSTHPAPFI